MARRRNILGIQHRRDSELPTHEARLVYFSSTDVTNGRMNTWLANKDTSKWHRTEGDNYVLFVKSSSVCFDSDSANIGELAHSSALLSLSQGQRLAASLSVGETETTGKCPRQDNVASGLTPLPASFATMWASNQLGYQYTSAISPKILRGSLVDNIERPTPNYEESTCDALPDLDTDLEGRRIEIAWRYIGTHLHAEEIVWCKGWVHSVSDKTYFKRSGRKIKSMLVNVWFDSVDISQGSSVAKFELRRSQWYPSSSHEPYKHWDWRFLTKAEIVHASSNVISGGDNFSRMVDAAISPAIICGSLVENNERSPPNYQESNCDALPDLDTDLEGRRIEVAWRYNRTHLQVEEIVWCKGWVHSVSDKTYFKKRNRRGLGRKIKSMLVNVRFDSEDISQESSLAKFELRRSQWYPSSSHEPYKHWDWRFLTKVENIHASSHANEFTSRYDESLTKVDVGRVLLDSHVAEFEIASEHFCS